MWCRRDRGTRIANPAGPHPHDPELRTVWTTTRASNRNAVTSGSGPRICSSEWAAWTTKSFAGRSACSPTVCRRSSGRRVSAPYDERWPIEERRAFVAAFVPRYTALALAALDRAEAAGADSLASLTDEDLQGMSLAEKWTLLAQGPDGCRPDQLRRELARLFMCKSYDLFHDAGLSEAAVEYPAYHRVREALEAQPDAVIADLVGLVVGHGARLRSRVPREVEAALIHIRDGLSQRLGIVITPDRLFAGQMLRLPLDHPDQVVEVAAPGRPRRPGTCQGSICGRPSSCWRI